MMGNVRPKNVQFGFKTLDLSSVIKTSRSEGSLLSKFYQFPCHYPLISYLSLPYLVLTKYPDSNFLLSSCDACLCFKSGHAKNVLPVTPLISTLMDYFSEKISISMLR